MSLKRFLPHLLILFTAIMYTACTLPDEFDPDKYNTTIEWAPGISAPLIYGEFNIEDLLTEFDTSGFLSIDDSGAMYLIYADSTSLMASDYLPDIPDQNFLQLFFSVPYDLPPDSFGILWDTILYSEGKSFEFARSGDERLDSIELKAGFVDIMVKSSIRHECIVNREVISVSYC